MARQLEFGGHGWYAKVRVPSEEPNPPRLLSSVPIPELRCLRALAPSEWVHEGQDRDRLTISVWCGCPDCHNYLRPLGPVYTRKRKKS